MCIRDRPKVDYATRKTINVTQMTQMPFTETVDGKTTTRIRMVARQIPTQVVQGTTETKGVTSSKVYEMDSVQCFAVDGSEMSEELIKRRLAENCPVILINSKDAIAPYFEAILKPKSMFMVCEKKMENKEKKKK